MTISLNRTTSISANTQERGRAWATLPNHSHRVKLLHVYTAPVCFTPPELRPPAVPLPKIRKIL
jgi:hypothetical protein